MPPIRFEPKNQPEMSKTEPNRLFLKTDQFSVFTNFLFYFIFWSWHYFFIFLFFGYIYYFQSSKNNIIFFFGKPKIETTVSVWRKPKTELTFKFPNRCITSIFLCVRACLCLLLRSITSVCLIIVLLFSEQGETMSCAVWKDEHEQTETDRCITSK